ncbi:hypothetical protein HDU78_005352 [Chytriomyces hyalinus]|nr:hypothetical protein HDU78_005352 [Chytriomyces hyalinus]
MRVNVVASLAAMSAVRTTAEAVYPRAIQELPQYAVKPAIISETEWNETTDPADEGNKVTTTVPAGGKAGYEAACSEASKGAGSGAGVFCGNGVAATAPFGNIYVSGAEALVRGSILTGVIGIIFA